MGITFKPGDTFSAAGVLSPIVGLEDYTGYTLECQFRDKPDGELLAQAEIEWAGSLVTPTPALTIKVPAATTANWPENNQVYFDVLIRDPTGNIATTETGVIQTDKRVTVETP